MSGPRAIVGIAAFCACALAVAQVDETIEQGVKRTERGQAAQQQLEKMDQERRGLVQEYSRVNKEIDGLEVYVAQLDRQLQSQRDEMDNLNQSIEEATLIERQIMPLMLKMIDALDQFVALDVPFLQGERTARVEHLQALVDRADVTAAEKFRNIHEAYLTEMEYGRTIEAYRGELETAGGAQEVEFLRIGRIGLFYQSLDGTDLGAWDAKAASWAPLDRSYRSQLDRGLRIAREQAAPDLIKLPLPTPEPTQ
ncbi:MAG: DUF3450 domain-containing protein [Pseudomonadota bacterium]|nr:DUF3450 domain-containing protein [Pseudomonadota bacterium]